MSDDKDKVVVAANKEKYVSQRTASGAKSLSIGDHVANALQGMNMDEVYKVGTSFLGTDFTENYAHLNVGMQRMAIGNRIRAKITKIDKENAALVADGKKAGPEGKDVFDKAAGPVIKGVAARVAAAKREADAKAAQAAKEKAAKEKAA